MDNDQKFEIIFKRSSKISSRSKEIIVMAYREKEEEKKARLELNQRGIKSTYLGSSHRSTQKIHNLNCVRS